jgi:GNAT superfamily N-acetyltransferase
MGTGEVVIRAATRADAPALAQVHLDTVLVAYVGIFPASAAVPSLEGTIREWEAAFADPTFRAFLAEHDGGAAGTVAVQAEPDPEPDGAPLRCGELLRLHVHPAWWGRGVGAALYDAAMAVLRDDGYREAGLWVLEKNERARAFYERRSWTLVPGRTREWPGLGVIEVRYRTPL